MPGNLEPDPYHRRGGPTTSSDEDSEYNRRIQEALRRQHAANVGAAPSFSEEGEFVEDIEPEDEEEEDDEEEEEEDEDEGMFSFLPPEPGSSTPATGAGADASGMDGGTFGRSGGLGMSTPGQHNSTPNPQYFYQPPVPVSGQQSGTISPKGTPPPNAILTNLSQGGTPSPHFPHPHQSPTSPTNNPYYQTQFYQPPRAQPNLQYSSPIATTNPMASHYQHSSPIRTINPMVSPPNQGSTVTPAPSDPLMSPSVSRRKGSLSGQTTVDTTVQPPKHSQATSPTTLRSASTNLPQTSQPPPHPLAGSSPPSQQPDSRRPSISNVLQQVPNSQSFDSNQTPSPPYMTTDPQQPFPGYPAVPPPGAGPLGPGRRSEEMARMLAEGLTPAEAIAARYRTHVGPPGAPPPPEDASGVSKRRSYRYVPESPTHVSGGQSLRNSGETADYVGYPPGTTRDMAVAGGANQTVGRKSIGAISEQSRMGRKSDLGGWLPGVEPSTDLKAKGASSIIVGRAVGLGDTTSTVSAGDGQRTFPPQTFAPFGELSLASDDKRYLREQAEHQDALETGMTDLRGRGGVQAHAVVVPPNTTLSDLAIALEDEEDSPYPEVRASVSNIDDPEMPALTFRSWTLGLLLCIIGVALNLFFLIRYPAPSISPTVIQVVAYPLGKAMAYALPTRNFIVPTWIPKFLGGGSDFSFNPGPFNIKEHTAIVIMCNASVYPAYAVNIMFTFEKFLHRPKGVGFDLLITLSTQIAGFGFAGICRRFLVWPGSMVWPQVLVACTLLNTFHAEEDEGNNGKTSRYKFFSIVASCAFFWYFLPDFLFRGLSVFSFICWIFPKHVVVNQLFGVTTGLGMGWLTFDWSQIIYIGSPLVVPWWAEVNVFIGFVLVYWMLLPLLYYTNTWFLAYLPMSSSDAYDRYGNIYDATRVIDSNFKLNKTAYEEYSPLYVPGTYAMVYCLAFALAISAIVHTILYHGKSIINRIKNLKTEEEDVHAKLMRYYPEVPDWWYLATLVSCIALAIMLIEIYDTNLPVWGLFLAIAVAALYLLPGGFIYALTSQTLSINIVAEIIPGYVFPELPIANMLFKTYAVQSLTVALNFIQDLKLGHYMKLPPRTTFTIQLVAAVVAALVQVGTKTWLSNNVHDLCDPHQKDGLTCPVASVFYTASIIWGLIGPQRQFGDKSLYHPQLYSLLVGLLLPIPFWLASRRWPNSWVKYVNIPVLLVGATYIPPATAINYSSWFLVAIIFQYWMRKHHFRWWSKFNFVTAAAMDTGTIISAVLIFFALQFPRHGTINVNWWGNNVFTRTADSVGAAYKTPPPGGFGQSTWS